MEKSEIKKLSVMYDGDKKRDASDKIRGFIFQNCIALEFLIQKNVDCVYLECLEDVDVIYKSGTVKIIQAKYYPSKRPIMKDISTDLYFQYLRLKMLDVKANVKLCLYIHRTSNINGLTTKTIEEYLELDDSIPPSRTYPNAKDSSDWLKDNINNVSKKETQKKKLFSEMSSLDSLKGFISSFRIIHKPSLEKYKESISLKLSLLYPNPNSYMDNTVWQTVLFGYAILFVQQRYMLVKPDFSKIAMEKSAFESHMAKCVPANDNSTIVAYLVGLVLQKHEEIIEHNDLSDLQIQFLVNIYQKTIEWIKKDASETLGQYRLLNTINRSCKSPSYDEFKKLSIGAKLDSIKECRDSFWDFLDYLWKIIIDICQDHITDTSQIEMNKELFDPMYYFVPGVDKFIYLNFPDDKFSNNSIIVPAGKKNTLINTMLGRLLELTPKPDKWLFDSNIKLRGRETRKYNLLNPKEQITVADTEDESFYIECMDCIRADEGCWNVNDECGTCIFSEKCKAEGKEK